MHSSTKSKLTPHFFSHEALNSFQDWVTSTMAPDLRPRQIAYFVRRNSLIYVKLVGLHEEVPFYSLRRVRIQTGQLQMPLVLRRPGPFEKHLML